MQKKLSSPAAIYADFSSSAQPDLKSSSPPAPRRPDEIKAS